MKNPASTFHHLLGIQQILALTFKDRKMRWNFYWALLALGMGVLSHLAIPWFLKKIVELFSSHSYQLITLILVSYGIIWTLNQFSLHLRSLLIYKVEQRIIFNLEKSVLSHLYSLSHNYVINQKPGSLTNIIRKAQDDVPNIIMGIFFYVIPIVLEFLLVIILISSLYPIAYSFYLTGILGSFFIYTLYTIKTSLKNREIFNEIDKKTDGVVTDWISNHEAVKTFGQNELAIQTCEKALKERETAEITFMKKYSSSRFGQAFILGIGLTALTYITGKNVINGALSVGDFILFNGYILQFISPVSILGQSIQNIKKALIDMKGILSLLDTKSEIIEAENPITLSGNHFQIFFKNVAFQYNERVILKNISFEIEPGETVLITGPTGIGKSTIAKLLLRLFDPTHGHILINNIDLKQISLQSLYATIGWAPQETYLLNDTIKNNLCFVHPEAKQIHIEEALECAHLLDFVKNLPHGLDTIVGNRGLKLSGGEKQRLSIARLFLKKPKICIFDESSSALDLRTELIIQNNIERYLPETTKIIITHHPEHIKNKAHKIINLENMHRVFQGKELTTIVS